MEPDILEQRTILNLEQFLQKVRAYFGAEHGKTVDALVTAQATCFPNSSEDAPFKVDLRCDYGNWRSFRGEDWYSGFRMEAEELCAEYKKRTLDKVAGCINGLGGVDSCIDEGRLLIFKEHQDDGA